MKKCIIAIIVLLFSFLYINMVYAAANTWTQKTDFGGSAGIDFGTGFSIGVKGYIGLGYNGSDLQEFWKYDPTANSWTQVASFTGAARASAVGFSIGTKGYVGLGADASYNNYTDFYEYDSVANSWKKMTDFPGTGGGRGSAVGFSIGAKGYVGTGGRKTGLLSATTYYQDFYEFDPTGNAGLGSWAAKTSFTGSARGGSVGFSVGTKGYVGTGAYGSTASPTVLKDFYEFDPAGNAGAGSWTAKTAFPGTARTAAVGFSIGSKGYVGTGGYPSTSSTSLIYYNDFYEYDPVADSWTAKLSFPATARYGAAGFSIGSRGYIGTGYSGTNGNSGTKVKDFYEYEPPTMPSPLYASFTNYGISKWDGNRWTQIASYVAQPMVTLGTTLYGAFTNAGIWKWDGSTWTKVTNNTPQLMAVSGSNLYGAFSNFGVWQWDSSTWIQIVQNNSTPYLMTVSGATLYAAILADKDIYKGIWKYDGSTWTRATPYTPQLMTASSSTLYGAFSGQGIWKYDGSTWTQATSYTPQLMTASSSTLYGAFSGQGIWKYNGSTWTQTTSYTPQLIAASSSNLYASFTGYGISQWDGSNWVQITSAIPISMAAGN